MYKMSSICFYDDHIHFYANKMLWKIERKKIMSMINVLSERNQWKQSTIFKIPILQSTALLLSFISILSKKNGHRTKKIVYSVWKEKWRRMENEYMEQERWMNLSRMFESFGCDKKILHSITVKLLYIFFVACVHNEFTVYKSFERLIV